MSNRTTIEEELERRGCGLFQTVGDSMEPLLHNRYTTVVIEKAPERLKKYDVALFRRPNGVYVLHRVVKVRKRDYLICGDNRTFRECVALEWIIGVMTGYFNGDAYISCESQDYRQYLRTLELRRLWLWWRTLPGRVRRKFFGKTPEAFYRKNG